MDSSVAERLSSLASKTDAFTKLEPPQLSQRDITTGQMAAVLGLVTARPDVQVINLAQVLAPKSTKVRWAQVFVICDSTTSDFSLVLSSPESTLALFAFLGTITPDAVHALLARKWNTLSLQTSLLSGITAVHSQQLRLASYNVEQIVTEGPLVMHPLNFVPVIHLVLDAVVREPPAEIVAKSFLDGHVKLVPELFLLGGVTIPEPWPPVLERILINLYALYFSEIADPGSPVLTRLASLSPGFMYMASLDLYARDASQMDRIALAAHSVGLLESWLDQTPKSGYGFTLELISAADRLGLASARSMLVAKFVTGGTDAIIALLDFMEIKIAAAAAVAAGSAPPPEANLLSLRTVAAFETLTSSVDVPPDRMEQLKAIQIQCLQTYPRLINFGQGHDDAILANNDLPTFPADVEQEMKMWFQRMYEQQIEIRDVISLLERLKESDEPRDQDLFACMTHSLFDEYRFFPEYPVNALATTAVLFGSLIRFRLIDNIPLSIALRFILESLSQPVETNMFRFGLQALFELRQRLPEFPKYCSVLLTIPGLMSQQQFYQQIRDIVYPSTSLELAAQENSFASINADMGILTSWSEQPSDQVKDKVLFFVNNLSPNNVKSKSKELVGVLDQRFYGWFAQYIVGERAIGEPNYHGLYVSMLLSINSQNLLGHCCYVLYLHVIRILNDEDVLAQDKRTQLKNLGMFLGSLLLANDRPVLYDNINFKFLLAEAVNQDKLPAVLPFVCKTIEKVADSIIFAPPNAWTMGILAVLSELYNFGNLKLNLRFEIEVLGNTLGLKIEEIEPSYYIRNNEAVQLEREMSSLHVDDHLATPVAVPPMASALPASIQSAGTPVAAASAALATPGAAVTALNEGMIGSSVQLIGTTDFVTHPALSRLLEAAIARTIQEVLVPVVDRSASIASYTTKELVSKDFAFEADEQKLRGAAHSLAATLSVSMSLVTARDSFVESLTSNLRAVMGANGYGEHTILMEQAPIAARENVDVIIPMVESAAREKAIAEIDDALIPAYSNRQRYQQAGAGVARPEHGFSGEPVSAYSAVLPEPLSLHPGGLLPQQWAVYDELALTGEPAGLEGSAGPPQAVLEQAVLQMQEHIDNLLRLVSESSETTLPALKPENKILGLVTLILTVATRSALRDEVILRTAQIVVSTMFSSPSTELGREVLSFLLGKLCELSPVTSNEVVLWLIYSDDERRCNVQVMGALIRSRLISATELDVNLAKDILSHLPGAINFAAGLILDSVLGPAPYSLRTEFTGSLEAMEALSREDPPNATAKNVLQALRKSRGEGWKTRDDGTGNSGSGNASGGGGKASVKAIAKHNEALKNKMGYVFAEWTRLVHHPRSSERSLHIFVFGLAEQNLLSHTEPLYTLVKTALDASVLSFERSAEAGLPLGETVIGVDALAKLLVTILQTTDKMSAEARLQYSRGILMLLALILARDHENKTDFNPLPYFRLWSTLLLHISEADDGSEFWEGLLIQVAEVFETLQPIAFPGFTASWISLISHRHFMPRLILLDKRKGWPLMNTLLEVLIHFLGVYADGKELSASLAVIYKSVVRIFMVILHDFPDYFVVSHWSLVSTIPSSFVQLRNLVLSAFPSDADVPNPLASPDTLKAEFNNAPPPSMVDVGDYLAKAGIQKLIDQAIQPRPGALTPQVVSAITSALVITPRKRETGFEYDTLSASVPGYNALAIYVASSVPYNNGTYDENSPQAMLMLRLLSTLNAETRYVAVSAMANQLRYPNEHTFFYGQLLLSIFTPFANRILKDGALDLRNIVSRVLLERIISNRPHPWGLMSTFSQLLSDKRYRFWELPFLKAVPDIEQTLTNLFQHINPELAS